MNTSLPLPPRLYLDVVCVRLARGGWVACSLALPDRIAGVTPDDAALKLVRVAESIAGEPVRALVTVEAEDEAVREVTAR